MTSFTPPFRSDHVGGLLHPKRVAEARAAHGRAAGLRAIENEETRRPIRMQEEVGLKVATDGAVRRAFRHFEP